MRCWIDNLTYHVSDLAVGFASAEQIEQISFKLILPISNDDPVGCELQLVFGNYSQKTILATIDAGSNPPAINFDTTCTMAINAHLIPRFIDHCLSCIDDESKFVSGCAAALGLS